jgi:hypothetical protein
VLLPELVRSNLPVVTAAVTSVAQKMPIGEGLERLPFNRLLLVWSPFEESVKNLVDLIGRPRKLLLCLLPCRPLLLSDRQADQGPLSILTPFGADSSADGVNLGPGQDPSATFTSIDLSPLDIPSTSMGSVPRMFAGPSVYCANCVLPWDVAGTGRFFCDGCWLPVHACRT